MSKRDKKVKKEQELSRREAYHPLDLFDAFERALFDKGFPFGSFQLPWRWPMHGELSPFQGQTPAVDVIDREHEILVRAEIPGVAKEDLDVSVTKNTVTLRGHSQKSDEEKEGEYYRRETHYGEFSRTVGLPSEVDPEGVKATFKKGVLEVTLQKAEQARRRGIEIESDE